MHSIKIKTRNQRKLSDVKFKEMTQQEQGIKKKNRIGKEEKRDSEKETE